MDELIAFVTARLDEWEAGTEDRNDNGQCDWLDGWHFDPDQMRRIIDSLRAIIDLHRPNAQPPSSRACVYCGHLWPCAEVAAIAAIWSGPGLPLFQPFTCPVSDPR